MKKSEIFNVVKDVLIDTLGIEEGREVTPGTKLMDELGAESIDLLDINARLERRFDISIDQESSGVDSYIRENASEEELETGIIPPEILKELPARMPEIDPEEFKEGLTFNDIPKLFTAGSLAYAVTLGLKNQKGIEIEDDMNSKFIP